MTRDEQVQLQAAQLRQDIEIASQQELARQRENLKRRQGAVDAYNIGSGLEKAYRLGTGLSQIIAGRKQMQTPIPAAEYYQPNQRLQSRLDEASTNAYRGLSPEAKALYADRMLQNQAFQQRAAQTISGGQQGVYGSVMQAGATDRNRAALEMAVAEDQARRSNRGEYDDLIARQMIEEQAQQQRNQQLRDQAYTQALNARQAGQAAESAGRRNIADVIQELPYYGSQLAYDYYQPNQAQETGGFSGGDLPEVSPVSDNGNNATTNSTGLSNYKASDMFGDGNGSLSNYQDQSMYGRVGQIDLGNIVDNNPDIQLALEWESFFNDADFEFQAQSDEIDLLTEKHNLY